MAPPFSNAVGCVSVEQETDTQRTLENVSKSGVGHVIRVMIIIVILLGKAISVWQILPVKKTIYSAKRQLSSEFTSDFGTSAFGGEGIVE